VSQLDLAVEAGVSSRHVSFIETGRAQPSREMILMLARVLDVPLRDRNDLLMAAGFAAMYRATDLDSPALEQARRALDFIRIRMWRDGRLLATYKDGHAHLAAYLDDYAFLMAALLELLQVPVGKVLHAEQSFDYQQPVHVGDEVEITRSVADIYDKRDGALTFIVVQTRYRVGALDAASSVQTILVRNAQGAAS